MDKRFQVFVSSTFKDLVDERREVMQALLELDCIPAGMELFPATDMSSWDLIAGVIDDCDYYIVMLAGRYGSLTAEGISFTEKEFDYAQNKKKPTLVFVHSNPDSIPKGKLDDAPSPELAEKLTKFIEKASAGRNVRAFDGPEQLGSVVSRSMIRLIKDQPGIGWVRGNQAMTPETAAEMSDLRARLAEVELGKVQAESTTVSGEDVAGLAQGMDDFEVNFELGPIEYGRLRATHNASEDLTWDFIFSVLGPTMIDEASESALRSRLNSAIVDLWIDLERFPSEIRTPGVSVQTMDFDKIKVQLRALNLIDKGSKKRPIADRQTYWRLTDRGDRHLASLLAIRRETDNDA